jgi:protein-tyrosine-phosphatase
MAWLRRWDEPVRSGSRRMIRRYTGDHLTEHRRLPGPLHLDCREREDRCGGIQTSVRYIGYECGGGSRFDPPFFPNHALNRLWKEDRPDPMKSLIRLDSPALAPARAFAKTVLGWINQVLHPTRRRRARRRVQALGSPRRILMVCTGNVCRSPYAEAWAKKREGEGDGLEFRSAGWMGPAGRVPPPDAMEVARAKGLDLDSHRSQLLSNELVAWADLLVVMERSHGRIARQEFGADDGRILLLGDLDPTLPRRREVLDPWGCAREVFEESFDRVDRCLNELFLLIGTGR